MRDAMDAADKAGRFDSLGFDEISLHSEYMEVAEYVLPSDMIRSVTEQLGYLMDKRNTESALAKIR